MIFNISNAPARVLPVLNSSYPQDVSLMESASGSATFQVQIATNGKPAKYTYQWYVNGSAVSGANGTSFTKSGLTSAATYTVYCAVTNKAGTVTSRVATLTVTSSTPVYTYTGNLTFVRESTYNWKIKFLTSGNLTFSYLGNAASGIDVFCVGGGGSGSRGPGPNYGLGPGGGGGYTSNSSNIKVMSDTSYSIVIGAGGAAKSGYDVDGNTGGQSSGFGVTANGGYGGSGKYYGSGGNGGSGGGAYGSYCNGGSDGSDGGGESGKSTGGKGQGTTTRAFTTGDLYAGGGGSSSVWGNGTGGAGGGADGNYSANANTGGGGGGGRAHDNYPSNAGNGGSGIVIIRNHR